MSVLDHPNPYFLYGTAWKEDDTARCVLDALDAGFRGIDTANQRRHYHEAGVGEGIARATQRGPVERGDLFLQTKFTLPRGQDHRLPYDPRASLADQVRQSLLGSLEHLGTDYVDSLVLHGPAQARGLTDDDAEMWTAMETLVEEGLVGRLGISNVAPEQLSGFIGLGRIRPAFLQNRCFASTGWDSDCREICREHDIVYQGFSLLTANRDVLAHRAVSEIAANRDATATQVIFRFALDVGMLPLTGTTDPVHMREDLAVFDLELSRDEVDIIEKIAASDEGR